MKDIDVWRERNFNGELLKIKSEFLRVNELPKNGVIYHNEDQYFYFEHDKGNFLHCDLFTPLKLKESDVVEFNRNPDSFDKFLSSLVVHTNKTKTPSYKTYLMRDSNTGMVKIGKSRYPSKREKTLQSEKPTIDLFAVCENNIEDQLHKKHSEYRIRGEWFLLNEGQIDMIIKKHGFALIDGV